MLDALFISVLNMSVTASFVVLVVLLVRLPLKKAPKVFSYALWAVVFFRLLCPFTVETELSVIPPAVKIASIHFDSTLEDVDFQTPSDIKANLEMNELNPEYPVYMGHSAPPALWVSSIWILGVFAMVIYSVIQFMRLKQKLIGATPLRDSIYLADHISSPFVMGFIKPCIYLPSSMTETEQAFIIAHEQYHVKRFDHIARILGFVALTIHWFNPLAWLAFALSGKDMEMSCDEAVMKRIGADIRAEYSQSLLRFATDKKFIAATPLAFGEGDTKNRVKNVMKYKKPTLWVMVLSLIAVVVLCVGFATNHSSDKSPIQWAKNLQVQDIDKIELVVQPSAGNEHYRLFTNDKLADIVKLVNESNGTYLESPEPVDGQSIALYITTKDGIRHTFINIGNTYLMIDGIAYNAEYDWLSSWRYSKGNAMLPSTFSFGNGQLLTLDGLKAIAQKGNFVSWEDFATFDGRDVGFGMYIMNYPMAEPYYVRVGGVPDETPIYVRLYSADTEQFIDIRQESIDDFVQDKTGVVPIGDLWENRTKYVGNNSAVGNIILYLNFPEKLNYDGFHLDTAQRPFGITVTFNTDTETRNFYTGALNQTPLQQNAIIMFSLVENVDVINFSLDDGENPYSESFYRESAQAIMANENLFAATETLESFGKIIKEVPIRLSDNTDTPFGVRSSAKYNTESEFLNHPDGVKFQAVAYKAAKAYFNGDSEELAACISENCIVDMSLDLFKDIDYMILKWSLDDIKAEDKIHAAYEFKLKGEDSVSFVSMEMVKIDSEWKVDSIGLEK